MSPHMRSLLSRALLRDDFDPGFPELGRPKYEELYAYVCDTYAAWAKKSKSYRKECKKMHKAEKRAAHVIDVFEHARQFASRLPFSDRARQSLLCAALLHDLMKLESGRFHHWDGADYIANHQKKLDKRTPKLLEVDWGLVEKAVELHKGNDWVKGLRKLLEDGTSLENIVVVILLRISDKLAHQGREDAATRTWQEAMECLRCYACI